MSRTANTPREEMEAALEAILFVSSEPIPRERLLEIFDEEEAEVASQALDEVLSRYGEEAGRGLMVDEVAGGVRLVTRPELAGWLRRFFEVRGGTKLSMAALETLAIIAYRQPITAPEIQELRSVNPSGVLKTLLERRLVRISGRKQVVGNPFLYRTTREFLTHFGLNSLKELPPLEEFEETFGLSGGVLTEGGEPADESEDLELDEGDELAEGDEGPDDDAVIDGDALRLAADDLRGSLAEQGPTEEGEEVVVLDREEIILRQAAELDEDDSEEDEDETEEESR